MLRFPRLLFAESRCSQIQKNLITLLGYFKTLLKSILAIGNCSVIFTGFKSENLN